ncbi:MAG: leucine-rich repeat protein, partial [Oscillospiraceae bacterium]|nr:leucine-rich repeat protein [Oscillospiraceae bacterium]
TYSVLPDNTAQITGYSGTAANLIVPDKLDGYTVTEIGKLCFSGNITLVSLKLPDTVTRIGTRAFAYCTNLASINYPLHLESAGDGYNGGFLFDGTRISSITVVLHPLHGQTLFLYARSTPYDGILPRRRTFFSTFLAVLLLLCRK